MTDVFIVSDNILSPLGATTEANFAQLKKVSSGIRLHNDTKISPEPFHASLFNNFQSNNKGTKFEQLLIGSIDDAIKNSGLNSKDKNTLLIISSTKGNISLLETEGDSPALKDKIALHHSAKLVAAHFGFVHQPVVVSNACISGLLALLTGMRLIQSGQYQNIVVAGADVISKFVLSGFQSFQAISKEACKPFDAARDGINLGEGAATIILSANKKDKNDIKITGGSVSNDANHISGPSRTGEELFQAIKKAIELAGLTAKDIDFISAHGTATIYNDEMEARAITLANMQNVPVNSLKGFYGHTLGAAGLIESVVTIQSMKENIVIPSKGYTQSGVTNSLNITTTLQSATLNNCLKTASGFGGCNAALVFSKQ
ncbi:MAG TPA: beta-ketoacyl synthase N-terminal-like domain-containing protein [Ferruginibacter sp.]|nr:beta-ketoacyl synthase N-terminal-like domain-containing protein [Ferruginibacter sp.]